MANILQLLIYLMFTRDEVRGDTRVLYYNTLLD